MNNTIKSLIEPHVGVPVRAVIRNTALSVPARMLWCVVASYCEPDGAAPCPSNATLMRDMGCTRATLRKCFKELEVSGLVKHDDGGMIVNTSAASVH